MRFVRSLMVIIPLLLTVTSITEFASAADTLEGYQPVELSTFKTVSAPSAMELVAPLYAAFPESVEGRPVIIVELRKNRDAAGLVIDIEMTGFLDDFIEGDKYRALVEREGQNWKLKAMGKKWKCYRGDNKGWHTKKCS